jgi:PAS domain S-box-containing protein
MRKQKELSKITLTDLISIDEMQRLQDLFAESNNVASLITDPYGSPITKPTNFSRLCNDVIRKTKIGCANCFKSDSVIGRHNPSGPIVQPCLSGGLWDAGASINIGGKHVANWMIGQVRNEEIDEQNILKYADIIGADRAEFMDALNEIPVMSKDKFEKIAKTLFVFANEFSENKYNNFLLKQEIRKREKVAKLLQESEEKYRILFNNSPDSYFLYSEGQIIDCNEAAERMMRCDKSKIIGLTPADLSPRYQPDGCISQEKANLMIQLAYKNGNHTFEWVHRRFDNTEIFVEISMADIAVDHKPTLFATWRDITERKKNESALQESERSKSVLLSNLPGMAYRCLYDRDWTMLFVSDQCYELTGYHKEQLLGNKAISFNELIVPKHQDFVWEMWMDGVNNHKSVRLEYQIITAKNEIKWVWEQGLPVYDSKGNIEALEGFIVEISNRKRVEAEIERKNIELSRVNAEKDKFFSIIAHDLRSPFNSFLGLTQILSEEHNNLSSEEISNFIESMKNSATNLYSLLENLLEWATIKRGHIPFSPELLNTQTIIRKGVQPLLEVANAKQISIIIDPINIPIIADEHMTTSIIRNLVSNALKFTPKGGKITISACKKMKNTEIQIADTGIGMNQKTKNSLFKIDQQIKRKGTDGEPSSGLGLILCKEFIEYHRGKIMVKSYEGIGTTFYLSIPNTRS